MVFLSIGMVLLLSALAFAIDIPQKEVVSQELRLAVDAAALGGAQALDGTAAGLRAAVGFVDQVMERNKVSGKFLSEDDYEIEFGFYSFPDKHFRSLAVGEDYRGIADADLPHAMHLGAPVAAMVNATRVSGKAIAPSVFSGVMGYLNLGEVTGNSVATANNNPKVCAFPFVIPLCALFLNQDPNKVGQLTTPDYEPVQQCARPLFVTNANYGSEQDAIGEQMRTDRMGGVYRASLYPRPNRINFGSNNLCNNAPGEGSNCISSPIIGTFVAPIGRDLNGDQMPDGDRLGNGLTVDDFVEMLHTIKANIGVRKREYCVDFQLGEIVSPLDNARLLKPTGEITDTILRREAGGANEAQEIDDLFYDLIYGAGSRPFTEIFGDASDPSGGAPKPNYPFLRNESIDRVIGDDDVRVLAPPMGAWEWTNPLCHSPLIPADNPSDAKAQTVVVPVVVPSSESGGVLPYQYCNAGTDVGNDTRVIVDPPRKETAPQIVGFVEVHLFDFNFRWLQKPDGSEGVTFERPKFLSRNGTLRGGGTVDDLIPLGGNSVR